MKLSMRPRYSFSSKLTGKTRKPVHTNKHRVAFPKQVSEVIRTSDIILEVLDARFIEQTRNKDVENSVLEQGKKLIFIINKADLVDVNELKMNYDFTKLQPYLLFSCKSRIGRAKLRDRIKIEVRKLKLGEKKARVGIIGYPNTGKSSLINILAVKKAASTSSQAGHTKAINKVRFNKDILILDTPGVFQDKEKPEVNSMDMRKHATIGVKTFNRIKDPEFIVAELMKKNPGKIEGFYGINADGDSEVLLEELGTRLNLKNKGNTVNYDRTARVVLKDWQEGKIK